VGEHCRLASFFLIVNTALDASLLCFNENNHDYDSEIHSLVKLCDGAQMAVQINKYLLFPNWWQHFPGLVIASKAMNTTLHQDQAKLAVFVLKQCPACYCNTVSAVKCTVTE